MTTNGKEQKPAEQREGLRDDSDRQASFTAELWLFLRENKKWWLLPMVVALLLLVALIVLGGTGSAPFVYKLF